MWLFVLWVRTRSRRAPGTARPSLLSNGWSPTLTITLSLTYLCSAGPSSTSGLRTAAPASLPPWSCGACTYENAGDAARCAVCDTERAAAGTEVDSSALAAALPSLSPTPMDAGAGESRSSSLDMVDLSEVPPAAILTPARHAALSRRSLTAAAAAIEIEDEPAALATSVPFNRKGRSGSAALPPARAPVPTSASVQPPRLRPVGSVVVIDDDEEEGDGSHMAVAGSMVVSPAATKSRGAAAGGEEECIWLDDSQPTDGRDGVGYAKGSAGAGGGVEGVQNVWSCSRCTFDNTATAAVCEMCGKPQQ